MNPIAIAKETNFSFTPDYGSDSTWVKDIKNHGLNFQFVVGYEINNYNYIPASYTNPAECDTHIEINDVSEVYVYDSKGKEVELTSAEIDELADIILHKLLEQRL
jgi:hypothetical protein